MHRRIAEFDNRFDEAFGRLRGRRWADRLFYGASAIGDHGMLWVLLAGVRALGASATVAPPHAPLSAWASSRWS